MVQRVLGSAPANPVTVPADAPGDYEEVNEEFQGIVEQARASDSLDDWRRVHEVATTCYANGYRVKYSTLRYWMVLQPAWMAAPVGRERDALSAEIDGISAFMRVYRLANHALPGASSEPIEWPQDGEEWKW
jgi:hypothetical protein